MPTDKPRLVARGAPPAVPVPEVACLATHHAVQFLGCWLTTHARAEPLGLEIVRIADDFRVCMANRLKRYDHLSRPVCGVAQTRAAATARLPLQIELQSGH
jgi:hypothetical protein